MTQPDPGRLASVPLFEGLSEGKLQRLAGWMEVEEFGDGRLPVRDKGAGYTFFVLDSGRARAEVDGRTVEILEPGAVFGEVAFFSTNGRRTATIIPDGPISVFSMFGTHFREMQMEMPEVADRLQELFETHVARDVEREQNS